MGNIKEKACYRPNFKSWKDLLKGTKKREYGTHIERTLNV